MYVESDTGTETKRFANVLRDMLGAASRWSQTFCATEQLLTGLVWFGFCDQTWTRTRLRPGQEAESSKSLQSLGVTQLMQVPLNTNCTLLYYKLSSEDKST